MYDAYASIYDAIGEGRLGARLAEWALQRLAADGRPPRRVLDLACGTGAATLVFAQAGCEVVGIDQSAAMLEIARSKARDAGYQVVFVQADMRSPAWIAMGRESAQIADGTRLPMRAGAVDLVTCFADSLSYLIEDGDLEAVFGSVATALRPGGSFIFDLPVEATYAAWDDRDVVLHDGSDCLVYNHLQYDPATRLGTAQIVWFVREIDRWWRDEETHTRRAWRDEEVHAALRQAGLAVTAGEAVEGMESTRAVWVVQR